MQRPYCQIPWYGCSEWWIEPKSWTELLLHVIGMKCKNNSYRKVSGALVKIFFCNTPAYAYPLFRSHTMTPDNLLNVDIKDIPVRLLQCAGNISTSHITTFLELILIPISTDFCRNCLYEFCQDSRQYIVDLFNRKDCLTKTRKTGKQKPAFYIAAADVKTLTSAQAWACAETR